MFKRKYRYLISYKFDHDDGFGECTLETKVKFKYDTVEGFKELIRRDLMFKNKYTDTKIVILNVIKL